jgi:4-amino-4-deoxy-L-arabinose transferase-like glycosyltransferase
MLIMALFPSQVLFTNVLASEMLFTPLFWGATLLLVRGARPTRWQFLVVLGGMILGLATLTRTITALYLIPVAVFWAVDLRRWRPVLSRVALASLGFALVITPWMVRNQNAVGRFCLSTNSGVNLFIGNQPGSGMGYNQDAAGYYDLGDPTKEAAIDSAASAQAWEYIKEKPLSFVGRGILKVGFLYATDLDPLEVQLSAATRPEGRSRWFLPAVLIQSFWLLTMLLALPGIWIVLRSRVHRGGGTWLVLGTLAYWTGVHFIYFSAGRFHFPLVPLIAALAAVFLAYRIDLAPSTRFSGPDGTK